MRLPGSGVVIVRPAHTDDLNGLHATMVSVLSEAPWSGCRPDDIIPLEGLRETLRYMERQGEVSLFIVELHSTDEGATDVSSIKDKGATDVSSIKDEGATDVSSIKDEGATDVSSIKDEGATDVSSIKDEGATDVSRVEDEREPGEVRMSTIIGWGELNGRRPSPLGHIAMMGMCLRKEFRKKGIGKFLLATMLDHVRGSTGFLGVIMEVADDNHRAIALYESAGFRQVGMIPEGITDLPGDRTSDLLIYHLSV